MGFEIQMKDQKVVFRDVINLFEDQRKIIVSSAPLRTMAEWRKCQTGLKIPLNEPQRERILQHKNGLVSNKDEHTLLKDRTIVFSDHSRRRIAMRVEGVDSNRPPKLDSILLVIKLVMESDVVDDEAEWKGHQSLVYTLIHKAYGERFKVCVTFEMIRNEHMKVITISNEHIDQLVTSLSEFPVIQQALTEMKCRIVKGK